MKCPFYTALSPIHGRGLFTNEYFPVGSILFKVCDKQGDITDFGKWVNHSINPNIMLHTEQDGYYAVSLIPIFAGKEIVANYNHTPSFLEKPSINW